MSIKATRSGSQIAASLSVSVSSLSIGFFGGVFGSRLRMSMASIARASSSKNIPVEEYSRFWLIDLTKGKRKKKLRDAPFPAHLGVINHHVADANVDSDGAAGLPVPRLLAGDQVAGPQLAGDDVLAAGIALKREGPLRVDVVGVGEGALQDGVRQDCVGRVGDVKVPGARLHLVDLGEQPALELKHRHKLSVELEEHHQVRAGALQRPCLHGGTAARELVVSGKRGRHLDRVFQPDPEIRE